MDMSATEELTAAILVLGLYKGDAFVSTKHPLSHAHTSGAVKEHKMNFVLILKLY